MTRFARPFLIVVVCLLGGRLVWSCLIPAFTAIFTDFPNYYTAAWALRHGNPMDLLYDPLWFQGATERAGIIGIGSAFNYFTPVSALVMWPLAGLPPIVAKQIWTLVNIAALAGIVILVARRTRIGWLPTAAIALLATDSLGNNFLFGQFYLVLTLLLVVAVSFAATRPGVSGFCLAAAAAVKLFPAVFLIYFAIRRQWRMVAWCGAWSVVIAVVSVWALGWEPNRIFIQEVLPRTLRGEIQDPYNVGWNSLQALLRRSFVPEPGLNPQPLMDAPALYFFIRPVVTLLIVAFSFRALAQPPAADPFVAFAILIAMVSLITPSQASYHYVLLIPGIAGLTANTRGRLRIFAIAAFVLVCSNLMTIVPFARAYLMMAFWGALMLTFRPRLAAAVLPAILVAGGASAYFELRRWQLDEVDRATMAFPGEHGYMEVEPRFVAGNLLYKSLVAAGFTLRSIPVGQHGDSESRSPDGRWIAYATAERGNWDIALREVRTGQTRIITSSAANDTMPVFSPDGRKVYFASDRRRGYRFSAIYEKSLE